MVIIRESPQKARSESQQWPPRSSREALLSSPSGRKKYKDMLNRKSTSPSPSPRKRLKLTSSGGPSSLGIPSDGEEEDDEDEETLQLKLQAIQAKLKLKRLQAAKEKDRVDGVAAEEAAGESSKTSGRPTSRAIAQPSSTVQVPLSPVKGRHLPQESKSPKRFLLGIDKGLRAQDVSLKRAANASSKFNSSTRPSDGPQRASSRSSNPEFGSEIPKVKSFSERLAESRRKDAESKEKEQRIAKARSRGFGLSKSNEDKLSYAADGRHKERLDETKSTTTYLKKPETSASRCPVNTQPTETEAGCSSEQTLEPYSGFHLSKRLLSHGVLTRALEGKEIYSLPRLLKEVKSPHYEPPDCETDYVVFGVIASKSAPRDHKNNPKSIDTAGDLDKQPPKFMAMRLTDLKWELDLFLFDTGFSRFWKLQPGTVIGILNPGIMPPKIRDTGAFSLKLTSSEDTVLEIGRAKALGFCSAKKSDGSECTAWVDNRKTTVCEFHISLQVEKAKKGRMEVNTMVGGGFGFSRGRGRGRGRGGGQGLWDEGGSRDGSNGIKREGEYHDKYLHETMWIAPSALGRSTASMLDEENPDLNAYSRGMSREELQRKRDKERTKELALAEKLSKEGNGTGSEYLRARAGISASNSLASTSHTASGPRQAEEEPTLTSLGLIKDASAVSLGPSANSKRKRETSSGAHRSEPMGWGGAFKRGLLLSPKKEQARPPPNEGIDKTIGGSSLREGSPKKRARFLLEEKGIREPGRESLGAVVQQKEHLDDDDDSDDLEIV